MKRRTAVTHRERPEVRAAIGPQATPVPLKPLDPRGPQPVDLTLQPHLRPRPHRGVLGVPWLQEGARPSGLCVGRGGREGGCETAQTGFSFLSLFLAESLPAFQHWALIEHGDKTWLACPIPTIATHTRLATQQKRLQLETNFLSNCFLQIFRRRAICLPPAKRKKTVTKKKTTLTVWF